MGRTVSTDSLAPVGGGAGLMDIYQNFSTSQTTWTVPSGATALVVWMTGGGGGGGSGENDYNSGSGGSGAGTGIKLITSPAEQYTHVLGAGGSGGQWSSGTGAHGGNGSVSRLYTGADTSSEVMRVPAGLRGYKADGGTSPMRGPAPAGTGDSDWVGCDFKIPGGGGGPAGGGYNSDNAHSGGTGGGTWWSPKGGSAGARHAQRKGDIGRTHWGAGSGGGGGTYMNAGNSNGNLPADCAGGAGKQGGILIYVYGAP